MKQCREKIWCQWPGRDDQGEIVQCVQPEGHEGLHVHTARGPLDETNEVVLTVEWESPTILMEIVEKRSKS